MALKEVRNSLSEVVDHVEREHDRVVFTKRGRPAAVVMSIDDLEPLEEPLDVVTRPRVVSRIRDSLADLASGEVEVLGKEQALELLGR